MSSLQLSTRAAPLVAAAVLLVYAAFPLSAFSQEDLWATHTSFRGSNAIATSEDAVWVATSGGVYRFSPESGEKTRYTVAEGLHGIDARAIAYDAGSDVLWVGYQDGVFDRVDVERGTVRSFFDVQRSERFPSRGVTRLITSGDSLYILTEFGIVIFDTRPTHLEVRDTYAQLGLDASAGVVVNDVARFAHNGEEHLAVATAAGIALAPSTEPNLQDPSVWTWIPTENQTGEARSIAFFDGSLYVAGEEGLFRGLPYGALERVNLSVRELRDLHVHDDRLYGTEQYALLEVMYGGAARRVGVEGLQAPRRVAAGPNGRLWIADAEAGAFAVPSPLPTGSVEPELTEVHPEGPYHGVFSQILVGEQGSLWAGGTFGFQTGVYRLEPDGTWTSFIGRNYDALVGRSTYLRVAEGVGGEIWAASQGHGLLQITAEDDLSVYDRSNSPLSAPPNSDPDYLRVGGVGVDAGGTVWLTNVLASTPVWALTENEEWIDARPRCSGYSSVGNVPERVYVDSYGNKWFIVVAESNLAQTRGLLLFDSGSSIESGEDDYCRFFNRVGSARGQGLPSVAVNAIAEDRDGRVWLATSSGPAYAHNSRILAQSTGEVFIWPQPTDRTEGNFLLSGVTINDVAVDPANRIWFATDNGAYAVEDAAEGGFSVVQHFTAANSPLLSDRVQQVATEGRTGRIFFGTDRGLISYRSTAVEPATQADDLFVYPNPVRIQGDTAPTVQIRGLVEATQLRVVTAAGELVARMETRGGQALWDVRDLEGRVVPSGMYLILAVGENGEGRAVGKVAVVR